MMPTVLENLQGIRERIDRAARKVGRNPNEVSLVAVSKRKPVAMIKEVSSCGQNVFGENYLQDAAGKIAQLPASVQWHFIGRIQSNKAKLIAELFDVVETVDRLKVALALEKHLVRLKKRLPVFMQINIGREPQKAGVLPDEAARLFEEISLRCSCLEIQGLMAMPPNSGDPEESRRYFREVKELAAQLEVEGLTESSLALSMGMSGDFEVAIEEGATHVRVGTALFGVRD